MAPLPPDIVNAIRGLLFYSSFDQIEMAYLKSVPDPADYVRQAEISVRKQNGIAPDEPIPPVEYDEHGDPSNDFHDDIAQLARELASTQNILVGSFTIALFHFIERKANQWLAVRHYEHLDVMNWLKTQGSTPDEHALAELQLVTNTLKHGPGRSASALFLLNPGLFDPVERLKPGFVPSDERLIVTKAMLDRYFDAAKTMI